MRPRIELAHQRAARARVLAVARLERVHQRASRASLAGRRRGTPIVIVTMPCDARNGPQLRIDRLRRQEARHDRDAAERRRGVGRIPHRRVAEVGPSRVAAGVGSRPCRALRSRRWRSWPSARRRGRSSPGSELLHRWCRSRRQRCRRCPRSIHRRHLRPRCRRRFRRYRPRCCRLRRRRRNRRASSRSSLRCLRALRCCCRTRPRYRRRRLPSAKVRRSVRRCPRAHCSRRRPNHHIRLLSAMPTARCSIHTRSAS